MAIGHLGILQNYSLKINLDKKKFKQQLKT
nr:MAG TPA: hypothetical protein [Caudoviricetes sp.]